MQQKWHKRIHTWNNNFTGTFTCIADAWPTLGAALGRRKGVAGTDDFYCDINAIATVQAASFDNSAVTSTRFKEHATFTFFSKSGVWCHISEEMILRQLLPEGFGKYNEVAPTIKYMDQWKKTNYEEFDETMN